MDRYKCDRCGETFEIPAIELPASLTKFEAGSRKDYNQELKDYELCPDCEASFAYFMEYPKDFDALADKIALKETGEE